MSRSGYHDDCDQWPLICWRGAVTSAIRGKRGQAFLIELLDALDALPKPELIAHELEEGDGAVCALGAVGKRRGIELVDLDPENWGRLASTFGIAEAMAREVMFINDEDAPYNETPAARFQRVRRWVESQIVAST